MLLLADHELIVLQLSVYQLLRVHFERIRIVDGQKFRELVRVVDPVVGQL